MDAKGFRAWREQFGLTQEEVAEKFNVTRMTVQNWESGARPISPALEMGCGVWTERLQQEDPERGPVALVYSNGPMFINPYGPRRPLAMMQHENYQTNAAALARVQKLWNRDDFQNPLIMEESGKQLWNVVELERVVNGTDTGAPTAANMLRAIAHQVKTSAMFASTGRRLPTPAEKIERQRKFGELAHDLEKLAEQAASGTDVRRQVETTFSEIRALGKRPPDVLVNNVAAAFWAYWETE